MVMRLYVPSPPLRTQFDDDGDDGDNGDNGDGDDGDDGGGRDARFCVSTVGSSAGLLIITIP